MTMAPNNPNLTDLYNLRWNSYYLNLSHIVWEHKSQETLVDVTLSSEGQFIKAHKLILSAASLYFQKIFAQHRTPDLVIVLNDVKFKDLQLIVQFMYRGEVKVAESDLQDFLTLGKTLEIKGLCTLDYPGPPTGSQPSEESIILKSSAEKQIATKEPITKVSHPLPSPVPDSFPPPKKRKLPTTVSTPPPTKPLKITTGPPAANTNNDSNYIPRPPNAFMIFANQWRKKLAVEYPNNSNKEISVRLGNMWKNLAQETKDSFYDDARKAEADHKRKYPGYHYSPKEARDRKAASGLQNKNFSTKEIIGVDSGESMDEDLLEIKSEEIHIDETAD